VLDKLFPLTGDMDVDAKAIREYVNTTYVAIRPERQ
jgi:hypothetical protein